MQEGGAGTAGPARPISQPARPAPADFWSRALSPLPWAVVLLVFTWAALYLLRRYLR
jgi:hypothetical protein